MLPVKAKKASHNEVLMTISTPNYRKTITQQMVEQLLLKLTKS